MSQIKQYTSGLLHILFPNICVACSSVLLKNEKSVCYKCLARLEPSRYSDYENNEIVNIFDGSFPVNLATVGFHYHKGGLLQELIFDLKYHSYKGLGLILGRALAHQLENTLFETLDYIIPVPLHPKKKRKRGYNQSEYIAMGIASGLDVMINTSVLFRSVNTISQTKKSRMERFDGMDGVFVVKTPELLIGKHVLLVDDVVTTGSTLIACAKVLLENCTDLKISIACLAKGD